MIGCLRTRLHKRPIIALYFEFETILKFYNLEANCHRRRHLRLHQQTQLQHAHKSDYHDKLKNKAFPDFLNKLRNLQMWSAAIFRHIHVYEGRFYVHRIGLYL